MTLLDGKAFASHRQHLPTLFRATTGPMQESLVHTHLSVFYYSYEPFKSTSRPHQSPCIYNVLCKSGGVIPVTHGWPKQEKMSNDSYSRLRLMIM